MRETIYLTIIDSIAMTRGGCMRSRTCRSKWHIPKFFIVTAIIIGLLVPGALSWTVHAENSSPGVNLATPSGFLYVCNYYDNDIYVIDASCNKVITGIQLDGRPECVLANPSGSRIYAGLNIGGIAVIDAATNDVIAKINLSSGVNDIAIMPDGKMAYAAGSGDAIYVLDLENNRMITGMNTGKTPMSVDISPDGKYAYVALYDGSASEMIVIDTSSNNVVKSIDGGKYTMDCKLSSDGKRLYTVCLDGDYQYQFRAIDVYTGYIVNEIDLSKRPVSMSLSDDGAYMYLTNTYDITIIDAADCKEVLSIDTGDKLYGSAVKEKSLYATNEAKNVIHVIDLDTGKVTGSVKVGNVPRCIIAVDGPENVATPADTKSPYLYVCDHNNASMIVLDTGSKNVIKRINLRCYPFDAVADKDLKKIYVTLNDWTISVIDISTDEVISSIFVGTLAEDLVISSAGDRAYFIDYFNGTVHFIDLGTKSVNILKTCESPRSIGLSPDGRKLYIADNQGPYDKNSNIVVLDAMTGSEIVKIPADGYIANVRISPDGSRIYISELSLHDNIMDMIVIDGSTNSVLDRIPMEEISYSTLITPDGKRIYVNSPGNVTVYDIPAGEKAAVINAGWRPGDMELYPEGDRLYVTDEDNSTILVIDTLTNEIVDRISMDVNPGKIVLIPDKDTEQIITPGRDERGNVSIEGKTFVCNYFNDTVSIFDHVNGTVRELKTGNGPACAIVSNDGSKLFVINDRSDDLCVIDTEKETVLSSIKTGRMPKSAAALPDGSRVFVANFLDGDVSVISTRFERQVASIDVGKMPSDIAVTPGADRLYVANYGSDNISVIDIRSRKVIDNIEGISRPVCLEISPDGKCLYVAGGVNGKRSLLTAIDTGTCRVTSTHKISGLPLDMAISPEGNQLFLSTSDSGILTVIYPEKQFETALIDISEYMPVSGTDSGELCGLALSRDGKIAYVTDRAGDKLFALDTGTNSLMFCSDTGKSPVSVTSLSNVIKPAGEEALGQGAAGYAYVPIRNSNSMLVIDVARNGIIGNIDAECPVLEMAIDGPGDKIYCYTGGNISVIDTGSNSVVSSAYLAERLHYFTVSPDSKYIYYTFYNSSDPDSSDIHVADALTGKTVRSIETGKIAMKLKLDHSGKLIFYNSIDPERTESNISVMDIASGKILASENILSGIQDIVISPDDKRLYIACSPNSLYPAGRILSMDAGSLKITGATNLMAIPTSMDITPDGKCLYVVLFDRDNDHALAIDTSSFSIIKDISVGRVPYKVAVDPEGRYAYVINNLGNNGRGSISVIDTANNTVIQMIENTGIPADIVFKRAADHPATPGFGWIIALICVIFIACTRSRKRS
ncbi:hypothetical protein [Methanooceanicella nereidis]|uniref:YVTN family beta-propeller repeat protein n=1 Tax=Methanooceanicella nereidis TaxID=2052831 RepID=UPI001E6195DE